MGKIDLISETLDGLEDIIPDEEILDDDDEFNDYDPHELARELSEDGVTPTIHGVSPSDLIDYRCGLEENDRVAAVAAELGLSNSEGPPPHFMPTDWLNAFFKNTASTDPSRIILMDRAGNEYDAPPFYCLKRTLIIPLGGENYVSGAVTRSGWAWFGSYGDDD